MRSLVAPSLCGRFHVEVARDLRPGVALMLPGMSDPFANLVVVTVPARHAKIKHLFECRGRFRESLIEIAHTFDRTPVRMET